MSVVKRQRTVAVAVVTGLLVVLSACASSGNDDVGDTFDVAVVMPSAADDLSFSQSMADSLTALKDDGVIDDLSFSENVVGIDNAAAALRDYAADGFDLVIAHGFQYGASVEEIAADFPDTAFAWGTPADTFGLDNVFGYVAAADEGGYVLGRMAAMLSASNTLGTIGPTEAGEAELFAVGFVNGAKSVVAGINVEVTWTDSFDDVAVAAEAATAMISAGADALSGSSQMAVGALDVAKSAGVRWFGTGVNQTQLAPNIVVASQVYRWEVALEPMIANIKSGVLGGEIYTIDLANAGEVIEFNDADDLPANVRADAETTIAGIQDGSIIVTGGDTGSSDG
jgi:basic membrane lipoprotein Med (substrate-binding protein (PBP1-ABC) superfamily)